MSQCERIPIKRSNYTLLKEAMYKKYKEESDRDNVFYVQCKNAGVDEMISWFETKDRIMYVGEISE